MSAECNDCVVLFKALSEAESGDDDAYSNLFRSANFQVTLVPVLDFEFVNLEDLLRKLKNPDDYEGIIFTSPRCVTAIELSTRNEDTISVLSKWQEHKHFVVGEKTAQMTEELNLISNGKEAGNAKHLAELMSRDCYSKQFLYPKGSLTNDTFKLLLNKNGTKVDEIVVYMTKQHPELETNIKKIKQLFSGKLPLFIYFSPSGVNFTLPLLEKYQFNLNQIKFIAIGPTTDGALKENGVQVAATALKPDPHSLLDAVLTYKKSEMQTC